MQMQKQMLGVCVAQAPSLERWHIRDLLCYGAWVLLAYMIVNISKKRQKQKQSNNQQPTKTSLEWRMARCVAFRILVVVSVGAALRARRAWVSVRGLLSVPCL
jgi:hypothetical protein